MTVNYPQINHLLHMKNTLFIKKNYHQKNEELSCYAGSVIGVKSDSLLLRYLSKKYSKCIWFHFTGAVVLSIFTQSMLCINLKLRLTSHHTPLLG